MAIALIACLLAFAVAHTVVDLVRLRDFSWFRSWVDSLVGKLPGEGAAVGLALAVLIGVPVALFGLLQWLFYGVAFGLPTLIFSTVMLFYCLGPRDLDQDIRHWLRAADKGERTAAAGALNAEGDPRAVQLIEPIFGQALQRWFGPLFWFLAFGVAGALLYRLSTLLASPSALRDRLSTDQRDAADVLYQALSFIPAHLMSLALALASDFDAVWKAWRGHHTQQGEGYLQLNLEFLGAAARGAIDADDVEDRLDTDIPPAGHDEPVRQAHTLITRILMLWFATLAVIVLAGAT